MPPLIASSSPSATHPRTPGLSAPLKSAPPCEGGRPRAPQEDAPGHRCTPPVHYSTPQSTTVKHSTLQCTKLRYTTYIQSTGLSGRPSLA